MAIFGYGRAGTKDRAAENQRLEIERAGYNVDRWYADEGVSGKVAASQRRQFAAMLQQIGDGETVVVTRLDRLGRDAQDVGATIGALAARGIQVIVLQLGKVDLGSAAGKPMMTMLAAVAEMERDQLVERTQSGLARAKAEGKTLGRPAKTSLEQRAAIVTEYSTGVSVSELARRYSVSRASILSIVAPKKTPEPPFLSAWGD